MSFLRKIWANGVAGGTPITADELNRLEAGVETLDLEKADTTEVEAAFVAERESNSQTYVAAASAATSVTRTATALDLHRIDNPGQGVTLQADAESTSLNLAPEGPGTSGFLTGHRAKAQWWDRPTAEAGARRPLSIETHGQADGVSDPANRNHVSFYTDDGTGPYGQYKIMQWDWGTDWIGTWGELNLFTDVKAAHDLDVQNTLTTRSAFVEENLNIGTTLPAGGTGLGIDGATGTSRELAMKTAGSARFILRLTGDAESGGNAGSNLQLLARNDTGGIIATVLTVTRSTGAVTLVTGVTAANMSVGSSTAGERGLVLRLLTERGWRFQQRNSGPGAALDLHSENDAKQFLVSSPADNIILSMVPTDAGGTLSLGPGTGSKIGFFGSTPTVKTSVTGSRGGNAALAALLTELAAKGLITDGTTA